MLVFESQKLPWLWLFCLLQPGLPWALLQKLIPIYLFFNQSQWNIFSTVSTMLRLTDECILWMSAIAAHCNLCQHAHVWICWYLNRHTLLTRSQLCSQQNINGRVLIKKNIIVMKPPLSIIEKLRCPDTVLKWSYLNGYKQALFTTVHFL